MPSVGYEGGLGTYSTTASTQATPDSQYNSATTVQTGAVVDQGALPPSVSASSPVASLASGIGGIVLFPGRVLVQQFIGVGGDPTDMSHLPVTVLLSAAAWYGLYWWLTKPGGPLHSRKRHTGGDE
jgi:hypothetical protein